MQRNIWNWQNCLSKRKLGLIGRGGKNVKTDCKCIEALHSPHTVPQQFQLFATCLRCLSSCIRQSVTFTFLSVWCRFSYEAANCCCLTILCSLLAFPVSVSQPCWQFFPTGWHPVLCLMQLVDCHKCLDITAKRKYFMVSKPMDLC